VPSRNMALSSGLAIAKWSGASLCGRHVIGGPSPDVVGSVVAHLWLDFGGESDVRELGEEIVDRSTATTDFYAEDQRADGLGRGR
jgi:hypothetical protein